MKATNLVTIDDYLTEIDRVQRLIRNSNRRVRGQWIVYQRRLQKEVRDYQRFKGVQYDSTRNLQ